MRRVRNCGPLPHRSRQHLLRMNGATMPHRAFWRAANLRREAISIYEVHAGSWQQHEDGSFLILGRTRRPADPLCGRDRLHPHRIHADLRVPFDPVVGLPDDRACSRRLPASANQRASARFVDGAHRAGIGVILDWVPAHFPVDAHGLALFDGTALYEHADPRKGFHPDWNTAIYNFGRREVISFLVNNALYWAEKFHVDGLRVDAVASMLYLDYSRKAGEWIPNQKGGRENLEAVSFPAADEQGALRPSSWCHDHRRGDRPRGRRCRSRSTRAGWASASSGTWASCTTRSTICQYEPIYRKYHHNELTFGLLYAFSENFVLPLSHDEVVHGKGTLLSKMAGDDWQKFANLRAYYAFMWGYPGKKLLFMGQEFAQRNEWSEAGALDWHELQYPPHQGVQKLIRDLNYLYRSRPALHARDCEPEGFSWLLADEARHVGLCLGPQGSGGKPVAVVSNFTPVPRQGYRLPLPAAGKWREIINTDATEYGGSGMGNAGAVEASAGEGGVVSATVTLPPLSTVMFELASE